MDVKRSCWTVSTSLTRWKRRTCLAFRTRYPYAHELVTTCFGMCRRNSGIFDDGDSEYGSVHVNDLQRDSAFASEQPVGGRLPTNMIASVWALRKSHEVETYIRWAVIALLVCMGVFGLWCALGVYADYKEEERVRLIMSGTKGFEGSSFLLLYHGHIEMKTFDNVDAYSRDASMQSKCRPVSQREYVTRMLDHSRNMAEHLNGVDYRDEDEYEEFAASVRLAVASDLEFTAHVLCHYAHTLHMSASREQPIFVTPKMLRVDDLKVAMRKGSEEVSPFVSLGSVELPDVCMVAYVRPDDDYAKADISSEALLSEAAHGRKPFESALGMDNDAFVHMTDVGVWPAHAGADEHMAADNEGRLFVTDRGLSATDARRRPARTWWNSGLHAIGPPGECAVLVNPRYMDKSHFSKDRAPTSNAHRITVYRRSAIIPKHNGKDVVFGTNVMRAVTLEHDTVVNNTLPDALMDVNSTHGFLYDGANAIAARLAFDTVHKNSEAQIVVDFMNGQWHIFDEIKRGIQYEHDSKKHRL